MSKQEETERPPEERPEEKSLVVFGRDVSKIPCFRNSFLYGITGGLSLGLVHFMFKSRPLSATNFAVYSFSFITMAYWVQCRYLYSKNKFELMKLQELLKTHTYYEGSEEDTDRKKPEIVDV